MNTAILIARFLLADLDFVILCSSDAKIWCLPFVGHLEFLTYSFYTSFFVLCAWQFDHYKFSDHNYGLLKYILDLGIFFFI